MKEVLTHPDDVPFFAEQVFAKATSQPAFVGRTGIQILEAY